MRSVTAIRRLVHAARDTAEAAALDFPAEFHRAVHTSDRRGRASVRAALASSRSFGRLVDDLRDHRPPGTAGLADRISAPVAAWLRLPAGGSDALGRRLPNRGCTGGARGS